MAIETTTYNTENLIGGNIFSTNVDIAAGTYYRGQALGMLTATTVYGDFDTVATYAVLNVTDIPAGAPIVINAVHPGVASGTAVLSADILYVNDATDEALAITARDAVAGLEDFRAVAVADVTFAAQGRMQVYTTGSELMKRGIVDGSGDQLTITQAIIENARSNSIILKN